MIKYFILVLFTASVYSSDKPNIIFILADDLGYHELGSYGQKKIKTPYLDQLRKDGMKFNRAYSGSAVCAPARCVLLTAKHPGKAFIRNNGEIKPEGQRPIPKTDITIAEILKSKGYVTGAFGKWGLGFPGSEGDPLKQGFDRFFGYNCQRHAHSYYPDYLWDNDKRIALDNKPPVHGHANFPEGSDKSDPKSYDIFKGKDYAPDRINEQALKFIKDNKDKPFFLYYPTIIPHLALHVPDEELKQYHELKWNDPPFTKEKKGYTPHFTPRAAYAAMITRMDRYIGNVIKLLDELKIADKTIVIFTSDNGVTHLKAEVDYDFFESNGKLRGHKGSLYEGGIKVPMIVKWPGVVKAGSQTDHMIGFEDILPTFADIIDVKSPNDINGISFLATLKGRVQKERPFLYREFSGYGGQVSVHMGKWKLVGQNLRSKKPRSFELYNLETDISESKNLSSQYPELVQKMVNIIKKERVPSKEFPLKGLDELK